MYLSSPRLPYIFSGVCVSSVSGKKTDYEKKRRVCPRFEGKMITKKYGVEVCELCVCVL